MQAYLYWAKKISWFSALYQTPNSLGAFNPNDVLFVRVANAVWGHQRNGDIGTGMLHELRFIVEPFSTILVLLVGILHASPLNQPAIARIDPLQTCHGFSRPCQLPKKGG